MAFRGFAVVGDASTRYAEELICVNNQGEFRVSLESELLQWLQEHLPGGPCLAVGLGDDGAVLKSTTGASVVTTDMLTEGVDFLIDEVTPEQVGHKALGVNLSDLAAMVARPVAAFVSLALPRSGTSRLSALELAQGMYRGMLPLAEKFHTTIAGGDTNTWDGPLVCSITAVGETTQQGALTRSGGRVGDRLLVTGSLGGSILGRHLAVEPRVHEALLLQEKYELHAGIDISDGLALDGSRLAAASGIGAVLDLSMIPISAAACELSEQDGSTPLQHALGDGEDFELMFAVPSTVAERMIKEQPLGVSLTAIGELVAEPGLWQLDDMGQRLPLEPTGFVHGGSA